MRFAGYAEIPELARFFFSCGSLPRSTQNSSREIPWRELTGIGHRLFCPPWTMPKPLATRRGAGTAEPREALRCRGSFHQFGSPFGKGVGFFGASDRFGPNLTAVSAIGD